MRPKKVRGSGLPMVNMGELFAHPRIHNLRMDLVPVGEGDAHFLLEPDDLLFARQSLVLEGAGQCSIFIGNSLPTVFESHLIRCRLDTSISNPHYYFYFFRSPAGRTAIETIAEQGAGASGIRASDLASLIVPCPPKDHQDYVVEVLAVLDDRITLLRETNATLEAIAQALFKSWFIDFDPVRAKMEGRVPEGMDEATAALFPDSLQQCDVGTVPAGWNVLKVEDVARKVGMGPFGSNIKVSTFSAEGVPVLNGRHLHSTLLADEDFSFIRPEHADRLANSCVGAGDIVLTHRGSIGQVSLIPAGTRFDRYVVSQSQFFLRCDEDLLPSEWMIYFFRSPGGQHLLLANASQVGVPAIAKPVTYLRSIRLIVPPPPIARTFSSIARALHARMLACQSSARTLTALRDTLLPRLISGQLRLPTAGRPMVHEAVV